MVLKLIKTISVNFVSLDVLSLTLEKMTLMNVSLIAHLLGRYMATIKVEYV